MKNLFLVSYFTLLSLFAFGQEPIYAKDGIALEGYDVVSYFEGTPMKGEKGFASEFEGVTFWFANADHLMDFEKAPLKYLPQYGGFCAYAMGKSGEKVSVNPETYLISNGKLYLFYDTLFVNTLKKWNKEGPEALQQKADDNWKAFQQ